MKSAAAGAEQAGAAVTYIDLREYPLPVFDEDLEREEGTPDSALQLKELFRANNGLLISSPEYNSSISAALKNAIDWVSRPQEGYEALDCFKGKVAGLMSTAAGGFGGMRGLPHIRAILQNIQVMVLPTMVAVPAAYQAFNDDGTLKDADKSAAVEALGRAVAELRAKLNP